jgi:hypothetical protein
MASSLCLSLERGEAKRADKEKERASSCLPSTLQAPRVHQLRLGTRGTSPGAGRRTAHYVTFSCPNCARVSDGTGLLCYFAGRPIVSREGIAFDYSSPAELYLSRRRGRHTDYRRFATAAEAIAYAIEELRTRRSLTAWMQVDDERFDKDEIHLLYDDDDYPLHTPLKS